LSFSFFAKNTQAVAATLRISSGNRFDPAADEIGGSWSRISASCLSHHATRRDSDIGRSEAVTIDIFAALRAVPANDMPSVSRERPVNDTPRTGTGSLKPISSTTAIARGFSTATFRAGAF
jgi:hypothetical protein